MALKKKPVTGMKDILPKEMEIRNYVMNMIRETYEMCIRDRSWGKGGYLYSGQNKGRIRNAQSADRKGGRGRNRYDHYL